MSDTPENHTLLLLREIRGDIAKLDAKIERVDARLDSFMAEQRAVNQGIDKKLDKLSVELAGVRGRVRKSEELLESIARVISDGAHPT